VFRIDFVRNVDDILGDVVTDEIFGAYSACAQSVQAHTRHDRHQPPGEVLNAAGVGPVEPEPGFLDGVVGIAVGAEHSVGNRP
jgi:hypothetical protein